MKHIKLFNNRDEVLNTEEDCPFVGAIRNLTKVMYASKNEFGDTVTIIEKGDDFILGYRTPANNEIWYTSTVKLNEYHESDDEDSSRSFDCFSPDAFNTTVVNHTFKNNQGVITFASDVTSVGDWAFADCDSSLISVTFPNSLITIGNNVFINDHELESVNIPDSVTSIGELAFSNNYKLKLSYIPNSVTIIKDYAFVYCTGLTSLIIGSGITDIGDYVFGNSTGLTSITIQATTPPSLGSGAIPSNVTAIYVPSASVNTYKTDANWSSFASKIQAMP